MAAPQRHRVRAVVLVGLLGALPSAARAQPPAASFDDLRAILKNGQTIVVTDIAGQRIKGKLRDVSSSPPSLVLAGPAPRTFLASSIAEVRKTEGVLNGALIGAGIGAGLALWDYLIDPSEPGNAAIFAVSMGLGTAIGAGIDALRDGGRVVYRSGMPKRSVTFVPIAQRSRRGVQVAVRF
ncbi:MAG TPA: hypothetical protein VFT47_00535 [Vicinamibacterales bacterium]|nr:hypothetical protein [Vicinamibacterales bacterium]